MDYTGYIDSANKYLICGWAVNSKNPNDRISVDIVINDEIVATCKASEFRQDLEAAGVSDGYSMFHFCPFYWLQRSENDIRIVYSDTDIIVRNGHFKLKSNYDEIAQKDKTSFFNEPKISVIMPVYNIDGIWLIKAIESVLNQNYKNWELCIVDDASTKSEIYDILEKYNQIDPRIHVQFFESNMGVSAASNAAARISTGEYISFLDHDDEILKSALFEIATVIASEKPDIIYSDELLMDTTRNAHGLHFKPSFSPDLLLSHNYITHFLTVKKSLFETVSGFSSEFNGAQDFDLVLKLTEKTNNIYHIAKALYMWRIIPGSVSMDAVTRPNSVKAGEFAIKKALERRSIRGKVETISSLGFYRVKRDIQNDPFVSILVVYKNDIEKYRQCMNGIIDKTKYKHIEIIVLHTGADTSINRITFQCDYNIRFINVESTFEFPKMMNYGVQFAKGSHLIFISSTTQLINHDWIESLLEHSQRTEVGAVGSKLYYPGNTIQHAGYIIGIRGIVGTSHRNYQRSDAGYNHRLDCIQNMSAVSSELMMVKKGLFDSINGFDETNYTTALYDVDFCLRLREKGFLNVYTPFCEAYNHISADTGFSLETSCVENFRKRWGELLKDGDPYYNPNLSLEDENFTYRN